MSRQSLPHSEESERAVLAGVMLDQALLPTVSGRLKPEDFYGERNQILYRAMLELQETQVGIDVRTVQAKLEQQALFEKAGGISYLANLDLDLPDLGRIESYVEIVHERSVRRQLIEASNQIIKSSLDGGLQASDGLLVAESALRNLASQLDARPVMTIGDLACSTLAEIEDRPAGQKVLGLSTGYPDMDRRTSGLQRGNYYVIAGATGMGKTSLAMNLGQNVAIRGGDPVGVISLEMSGSELALRMLASEADVPFSRLRSGTLSHPQWIRVHAAAGALQKAPIYIDDNGTQTIGQIQAKARKWVAQFGIKLLILDYLQLASVAHKSSNREQDVAAVSRGLKLIAKDLAIAVIALSQLSRPEKGRSNKRPQLSDLRESGTIENDSDGVCGIYRPAYYEPDNPDLKGVAEAIWLKVRNGEPGTDELVFLGHNTTFKSLARQSEPPPANRTPDDAPF